MFFWVLFMLPMLEERRENEVSYGLYPRALNLPSYHDITESDIDRVCDIVRRSIKR